MIDKKWLINLDNEFAMSGEWASYAVKLSDELARGAPMSKADKRVFGMLIRYASNKAAAYLLRRMGRCDEALDCERKCDTIYQRLPRYAQW